MVDAVGGALFGSDLAVGSGGGGLGGEERGEFGCELRGASCALVGEAVNVVDGGLHALQSEVGAVAGGLGGRPGWCRRSGGRLVRCGGCRARRGRLVGLLVEAGGDGRPLLASSVGFFEVARRRRLS